MSITSTNPSGHNERLEQVLAEYLRAVEAGQSLDQAKLLATHPDLADELRSFFANRSAMERIAQPLKASAIEPTVGLATGDVPNEPNRVRYFGDYELLEELGRGGMGVVYKARQTTLNRLVALKMILSGELASSADVQRFRQEAEAAANLDHPNIAPIYETGEHNGQQYFSMKLIEGRSLREAWDGRPEQVGAVPARPADSRRNCEDLFRPTGGVRLLAAVARAVHHAHQRGVLHRHRIACGGGNPFSQAPGDYRLRVWDVTSGQEVFTLTGHNGDVNSLAFSPDGSRLASGGYEVKLWDAETGKEISTLADALSPVVFSPDGKRLLTCGPNGTMKIWNAESGMLVSTIPGGTNRTIGRSLAWSPDGTRIVGSSQNQSLKVWDARSGESVLELAQSKEHQPTVAFSPDEQLIAGVGYDHAISLWDAKTGKRLRRLQVWNAATGDVLLTLAEQPDTVNCVAFSPDGQLIASGSRDNSLTLWDARTGDEVRKLTGHGSAAYCVTFTRDGTRIVSGSFDDTVKVWDVHTGEERLTYHGHMQGVGGILSIALSPDGRHVVSGSADRSIRVWELETGREQQTLLGHTSAVYAVDISSDGRRIASGGFDKTLRIWDAETGQETLLLKGQQAALHAVAFSPDCRRLISGAESVKVWDGGTRRTSRSINTHAVAVTTLVFSPEGQRVVSGGSYDRTPKVWDTRTGQRLLTLIGGGHPVAFSPDGRRLLTVVGDNSLQLWDVATEQKLLTLNDCRNPAVFSADGQRITCCGTDKSIQVRDVTTGQVLQTRPGPTGAEFVLAMNSDGQRVIGSDGKVLTLWDVTAGRELRSFGVENQVAFSADGRQLVTGQTSLKIWNAVTGEELRTLGTAIGPIHGLAFSADGRCLAVASERTVKRLDSQTGQVVEVFKEHSSSVTSLAFSPDSRRLASGNWDGLLLFSIVEP